jgi:hypothetical protein
MYKAILLASFLFCLSFHSTAAQQPTTTQRDAIRSSCRSDFIARCSGALECLERNRDSLSASCKTIDAVAGRPLATLASAETPPAAEAITPPAATPAAPSVPERRLSILRICRTDVTTLCGGTPPGGGRFGAGPCSAAADRGNRSATGRQLR